MDPLINTRYKNICNIYIYIYMKSPLSKLKLCTPAYIYLVISVITLILMGFQNINSNSMYCIGNYECEVPNTSIVFIIKILYIAFWTWLLNVICKGGGSIISWIIVLVPFLLMFFFIGSFLLFNRTLPSYY